MSNLKNILSSFKLRNTLNLKIWELSDKDKDSNNTPNNYKIYPEIRERLLEIAYRFIDSFDIDVVIDDIIITGSLVNFNWSKFSDVDLHVLINFKQFPEKHRSLYVELLDLKKVLFNLKYNIKVKGFDVELYAQDKSVTSFSSGVYSVLFDKWESFPNKEKVEIDKEAILNKTNQWTQIIDSAIDEASDKNLEDGLKILNKFKDKLKKYRTSGLEEGGEYSNENLVFKALRRNGYIGKLYDFKNKLMSNKLSLTESYLNEANTHGFPEGNVDSGKVLTGGEGGNWGGSMDIALEILSFAKDCKGGDRVVSSQKRSRKKTASGNVSDHYVGNLGAYAVDIPTSGKQGDELLACIMEKWNGGSNKDYKGGKWLNVNVGGYRYQFGWRVKDHYNHIHVGVKKNNTGIDTDSEIKNELVTDAEKSEFLEKLKSIANSDKKFKNLKEDDNRVPYDPDVEIIQTSLQFLGFSLPEWGVDGKFGPETEEASNQFKSEYLSLLDKHKHLISTEKNVLTNDDIKVLYASLLKEGFQDSDLSGIQKKVDKELSLTEGLTLRINSPFGPRWGRKHRGTDYASVTGNQILVKKPGIVETIETNCKVGQRKCGGRWGNYVLIDHGDNIKTRYAHLSKVFVKKNEEINNTIIGETGNTGGSDGPHLHFEYLLNNERINGAEFANDYFELNGIDSPSFENSKKEVNSKIKNELVTDAEKSEFLEELKSIANSDKTFKNLKEDGHIIPYDPDVEIIQTSLQFLGFLLPKWGVDGKFGPETEEASNQFKSEYLSVLDKYKHLISTEENVLTNDDIKVLYASLLDKKFVDSDLTGIQKKSDFSNINIGNDKEFYEEILKCVGAPITDENLKFLYAWRQAEGATANNNPFNTTMPFKNAIPYGKNTDGVKEYQTRQDGLEATCKTLNLSYYTCIVEGLIKDIGAELISTKCDSALKKWGTHATTPLITKVLKGKIDPPPIATS